MSDVADSVAAVVEQDDLMALWFLIGAAAGFILFPLIQHVGANARQHWAAYPQLVGQRSPAPGRATMWRVLPNLVIPLAAIAVAGFLYAPDWTIKLPGAAFGPSLETAKDSATLASTDVEALQDFLDSGVVPSGQIDEAGHIRMLEERLRGNPDSGEDWEALAGFLFEAQRYDEAADAYGRAAALLGVSAERLANMGEAMVQANEGLVSNQARALFEQAKGLDPDLVQVQFYLALATEQDGDFQSALAAWKSLLARAPADAFWKPVVQKRLEAVAARLNSSPKPSLANASVHATLQPNASEDMIERMVSGLHERLQTDGSDVEGWIMLMRSYQVMGRTDRAHAASRRAQTQFADNADALSRIKQAMVELKIEEEIPVN